MADDPVVIALRAAIENSDSVDLRLALGQRYFDSGEFAQALREFEAALTIVPTHSGALGRAADAAARVGAASKEAAYRLALSRAGASATDASASIAGPCISSESNRGVPPKAQESVQLRVVEGGQTEVDSQPGLSFADVGGMDDVKERLTRSVLLPIRNPEMFKKFGKPVGGGLVLYGPPGCGKTYIARALAGEIGARLISVGLSQVLDMWFGESERKLHELFENARRRRPTLMFFDELDGLGRRRSEMRGDGGRTLMSQLLSELDGFEGRNEGVFLLAATNHPWDLDPALRRPGRFDRLVFVPPPAEAARAYILKRKLHGRPVADAVSLERLSRVTAGFSGADIEALVDSATELAIERSILEGAQQPIDDTFLDRALAEIRPSTRPWFELARNYAIYANEGGSYDDLLRYLEKMGLG